MAKVYEVVGIANQSILWRGIMFEPAERVYLVLTEEEIEFLGSALSISSKREVGEPTKTAEKVEEVKTEPTEQVVEEIKPAEEKPQDPKPTTTPKPKPVTKNSPKGNGNNGKNSRRT